MTRPVIGRQYRPTHFETRRSDGTYAALNPRMTVDELRVQDTLLGARTRPYALVTTGCTAAFILLYAVPYIFMSN